MTSTKIEARIDEAVVRAIDEILSFTDSEAAKNPVMVLIWADVLLFVLTFPLLFGLLCVSVACREVEARRKG